MRGDLVIPKLTYINLNSFGQNNLANWHGFCPFLISVLGQYCAKKNGGREFVKEECHGRKMKNGHPPARMTVIYAASFC